tara:strand:- start:441 stop:674 length:234 start_codon:yes stop_codon:yes gene_type:complete
MDLLDSFISWSYTFGATAVTIWIIGALFTFGFVSTGGKKIRSELNLEETFITWSLMVIILMFFWPVMLGYLLAPSDK